MAHANTKLQAPGKLNVTKNFKVVYYAASFVGLIAFVFTLIMNQERAWHAFLVGFFYFTSLAMGGFFFTSVHHLTNAGWNVNIRRISEAFTNFLPTALIAGLILLIGSYSLFEWLHPEAVQADHLLKHKESYLNQPFFIIRFVGCLVLWVFLAKKMVSNSVKQDETGDPKLTLKNVPLSVASIFIFAITYSIFSVDTIMSLAPHWFSTIFGVYTFAGLFQSTVAAMILLILYIKKNGQLSGYVTEDHLHDLGKYLFGFTVFWAYIAYSQYMLIWYANIPEETFFFIDRTKGSWVYVSLALLLFKFIVPFFALLPRWAKRTPAHLAAVSVLILIMQFVDIYWLVYPSFNAETIIFGVPEVLIFIGFMGAFLFAVSRFLQKNNLVPVKDPRIEESINHHVVY